MSCSNRKVPKDLLSLKDNRTHCQVVLFRDHSTKDTFRYADMGHLL